MILNLGVTDIPYSNAMSATEKRTIRWRSRMKPWQRVPSTTTTGDVAEILEARYGIMQMFFLLHGQDIADSLENVIQGKLENLMMGAPISGQMFEEGDFSAIEETFRKFLDNKEMDGRAGGVPTRASLMGVNHRLRHPYSRSNPPRPSFIDTGQFQSAFKVWVSDA